MCYAVLCFVARRKYLLNSICPLRRSPSRILPLPSQQSVNLSSAFAFHHSCFKLVAIYPHWSCCNSWVCFSGDYNNQFPPPPPAPVPHVTGKFRVITEGPQKKFYNHLWAIFSIHFPLSIYSCLQHVGCKKRWDQGHWDLLSFSGGFFGHTWAPLMGSNIC